ncbi:MAG: N-acetylglucosamine-6-phosphate deacetylase [Chloroflexi bacterium]|jgi:N-acetylglucosamine-6-phosphate deacetylase|nr:N-acetylglucosamine-6-phosphate deacetylase [Chloroflexota bacterium]
MTPILFHGGPVCTRGGYLPRGWLQADGGRIAALGEGDPPAGLAGQRVNLAGRTLAPGFIDLHAHGAVGADTMDATPAALRAMARFYARHGVTGFLATTVTSSLAGVLAALQNVSTTMAEGTGGAALLGAHVEGPFLDPGRLGAQDAAHVRAAALDELHPLLDTGVVRMLTLAPELPGAGALLEAATARGAVVSAGHTRATYEEMAAAAQRGLRHVTHLFNGMEPLHHRQPGVVGAALAMSGLTCELIADNIHVHPGALLLAWRAKGTDAIALVTDAMRGAGMPDGQYTLGGLGVTVQGGVARLASGNLAGSTLTLERALANMMAATGLPLPEALPMATAVPARELGLLGRKGSLAVGLDADLIVLNADLQVDLTVVGGEIVYASGALPITGLA